MRGNVFLKPYLLGLEMNIAKKLEKEVVKVITPMTEKYKDRTRLTVSLSKYLKTTYSPNKAADPMNGNL